MAQIYGKPIYTIADVAILPISNQSEANEAIIAASKTRSGDQDSEQSDQSESEDEVPHAVQNDLAGSPGDDDKPYLHKNKSNTSIAEDVAKRKASYGKFASQWFSKRTWISGGQSSSTTQASDHQRPRAESKSSIEMQDYVASQATETNEESKEEIADKETVTSTKELTTNTSAVALLPKILRSTKMILSSRSYYFAYDFDLTRRFALQEKKSLLVTCEKLDPLVQ